MISETLTSDLRVSWKTVFHDTTSTLFNIDNNRKFVDRGGNFLHILEFQKFQLNFILKMSQNSSCDLSLKSAGLVLSWVWNHFLCESITFYEETDFKWDSMSTKKGCYIFSVRNHERTPESILRSAGEEGSSTLLKSCVLLRVIALPEEECMNFMQV